MENYKLVGCIPEMSSEGDFYVSKNIEVILQSIFVILVTPPGSRVWQPDFGCKLLNMIFSLETDEILEEAKQEVKTALEKWEPRIKIRNVETEFQGDRYSRGLLVTIKFTYNDRNYEYEFPVVEDQDMLSQTLYSLKVKKIEKV
jgi:phage baseplate assembly protein W